MTYSEENVKDGGAETPSFTAVLQAQGNVEDHGDAGRTTSKTGPKYQWLRTAQDRTAWRAKVSQE